MNENQKVLKDTVYLSEMYHLISECFFLIMEDVNETARKQYVT